MGSCSFIQKAVFSFAGGDVKFVLTYHIVEHICINAGGIDNNFGINTVCFIRVGVKGFDMVALRCFADICHAGV